MSAARSSHPAHQQIAAALAWLRQHVAPAAQLLCLLHISEPTRRTPISYAVFCLN